MQTGLMAFEIVSKINRIDIDLRSISREFGISDAEISKEELIRIAQKSGFKAKIKNYPLDETQKYPMPAIFLLHNKSFGVILIANYDEKKALIFIPEEKQSREVTFEEFDDLAAGELIFLSHKMINSQIKFGFKWFYAEVMKYKRIILEVWIFCRSAFWPSNTTFYSSNT